MGMLVEMVLCVWNFVACVFWVRSDNTVQRGIGSSMIYCVKEFYIWFDRHNSPGCWSDMDVWEDVGSCDTVLENNLNIFLSWVEPACLL